MNRFGITRGLGFLPAAARSARGFISCRGETFEWHAETPADSGAGGGAQPGRRALRALPRSHVRQVGDAARRADRRVRAEARGRRRRSAQRGDVARRRSALSRASLAISQNDPWALNLLAMVERDTRAARRGATHAGARGRRTPAAIRRSSTISRCCAALQGDRSSRAAAATARCARRQFRAGAAAARGARRLKPRDARPATPVEPEPRPCPSATPSTPSPAASPPSSTPAPPASSRPRARTATRIGKVYAGRNGIIGALTEDLIDTSREPRARHRRAEAHAGRRLRLLPLQAEGPRGEPRAVRAADRGVPRARHRLLLLQRRQRLGRHLPQGVADRRSSWAIRCTAVHVPKTVDNDLPITDNCPGFGSVAKYVAVSMREAAFDVASMAKTSTKVFVLEVMGRHAGWITAAVGHGRGRRHADPAGAAVPGDSLRRGEVPRRRRRQGQALRLLLRRRVRGAAGRRRAS